MFSMLPSPSHTHIQAHHHYTPVHPSPLSSSPLRSSPTDAPLTPRHPNVPSPSPPSTPTCFSYRTPNPMMSPTPTPKSSNQPRSPNPASSSGSATARESVYSRRPTKANPLIHRNPQDGRETRRKLFLKRVKDKSADRRYGGDEEMMRRIWLAEERRREEAIRREAMGLEPGLDEEELEDFGNLDEVLVEEIAREEEEELEALLGLMEGEASNTTAPQEQQHSETPYGSDDEEYDHIFMDVIMEEKMTASQEQSQQPEHPDTAFDMMDMS